MKAVMNKLHRKWRSFLLRLAEANRQSFGSRPPDCCGMNRRKPSRPDEET